MKFIKRFIYLVYYIKETDYRKLRKYLSFAVTKTGKSGFIIILDVIKSVFRYNISLLDYFYFRFFESESKERSKWAGTGYMYEYQIRMNPKNSRDILENKIIFLNQYQQFVRREYMSLEELEHNPDQARDILHNLSGRIVLKNSLGQVGAEVEVVPTKDLTTTRLIDYMKRSNFNLAEQYVVQHPLLMELSPTGLNTVRIFTQLENNKVRILGARLRISVNSSVDNMGAGNLAAAVDVKNGIVTKPAVYSDIEKQEEEFHPVSGKRIIGFQVPHWESVIEVSKAAALLNKDNRSIGWDIAITDSGVDLIEGNHNWCKLLWQLPVQQGMKDELEKYL